MMEHNGSKVGESPFRSTRTNPAEREKKRAALLLSAVRMFNERGYHATSLDEVAANLGVTKPVIYHYLGNKERVLFECVGIGLTRLQNAVERAQRYPGNGLDQLKFFMRCYALVIMDDFGRCVIRTGDENLSLEMKDQFREAKRKIDVELRALLLAASVDGSANVRDVRITAFALAGGLNWLARWYLPEGQIGPEVMAIQLVEVLCTGIEPKS
jgi:AcrR family transcriptional regulator